MNKKLAILFFLLCLSMSRIWSLEIELGGGIGNLTFDKDLKTALSDPTIEGTFDPELYPLILARFSAEYESLLFNAGFKREPLLRNMLYGNLRAGFDFFYIEAGPVIGLFNSSKLPINPGLSAALGFSIPGIIFIEAGASSTIGSRNDTTGNYTWISGDLSAGFWVPHVICSLNMRVKNFTGREEKNLLIEDNCKRYFFRADVYTKNIQFTIKVDFGFQNLGRYYTTQKIDNNDLVIDESKDIFKSLFAGIEASYTVNSMIKFYLGAEMPVYSWGVRPMKDPPKNKMLFEARMGIILNFAKRTD